MTFEQALTARIEATVDLGRMLAEDGGWSVRFVQLPGIALQIVADPRPQHFKGFQRIRQTDVQVDVYAPDRSVAVATRNALITLLVPADLVDGIQFQRAMVSMIRSPTETEQSGERQRFRGDLARESIDFIFTHNAN